MAPITRRCARTVTRRRACRTAVGAFAATRSRASTVAVAATVAATFAAGTIDGAAVGSQARIAQAIFGRNGLAGEALDAPQQIALVVGAQRDGAAFGAGAGRPPDAMHVGLGHLGQLEIDDVRDVVDVDATGRNVGRDQDAQLGVAEEVERMLALLLALVAVNGGDTNAGRVQMLGHLVGATLGAREDERARHGGIGEQLGQQGALLGRFDVNDALVHPVDGRGHRRHRDFDGIAQELTGQRGNFVRHGGGEEQGLPACGQTADNATDRLHEAQIEHLVGFVEHQYFGTFDVGVALLHMIEQAAGGRHKHVDAVGERLDLGTVRDAAVHDRDGELQMATIRAEAFCDLGGQFARRRQHQDAAALAGRRATVGGEAMQDRQREGGRFAGAGLRNAEQVGAGHDDRDGFCLDRSRRRIAFALQRLEERRSEAEISKLCHRETFIGGEHAKARRQRGRTRGSRFDSGDAPRGLGSRMDGRIEALYRRTDGGSWQCPRAWTSPFTRLERREPLFERLAVVSCCSATVNRIMGPRRARG